MGTSEAYYVMRENPVKPTGFFLSGVAGGAILALKRGGD
jgi:hypothetical protein